MYLLHSQETIIEEGFGGYWSTTTKRYRIKIFNQQGFKYANVKIPIRVNKYRKLSDIKGFVYYTDSLGRTITQKITRQEIFKDKAAKGLTSIAFAFPNVKEGCVIEFTYTYEDKHSITVPTWLIQHPIPTATGYCRVEVPVGNLLDQKIVSDEALKRNDTIITPGYGSKRMVRSFVASNIAAFKPEPLMGPVRNALQRIEFSLGLYPGLIGFFSEARWATYTEFLYKQANKFKEEKLSGTDTLIANAKKLPTITARVGYLFEALKKNLKWDEVQTYFASDIRTAWKEKSGTSAEMNLILMNLLHRAGIPSSPLLVSTRNHGKIDKEFVNFGQFNGLDLLVSDSGQYFVLDLTQKNLSYKITPYNVVNTEAMLLDASIGKWVSIIDSRSLFRQAFIIFCDLDSLGLVQGAATIEHFDYAKDVKLTADKDESSDEISFTALQEDKKNITVEDKKTEGPDDPLSPLVERFNFKVQLSTDDNFLLINPSFLADFNDNPFISDVRKYDVDMGSNQSLSINLSMLLPKNYTVEQLPKNLTLIKSDSTVIFRRILAVQGNTLQCLIRLEYLESYFPKEDYPDLKEFFSKMYGYLNEPVILRRKQ